LILIGRRAGGGQAEAMDTTTASSPGNESAPSTAGAEPSAHVKALTRRRNDRMLAGVAAGIAGYAGVDVLLVRIGFAVLTVVGGLGIPLYLACWLLIPDEGSTESVAADFTRNLQTWRN
jgi:phage shock protein PspC (stress-responsive transcriptional regulator)